MGVNTAGNCWHISSYSSGPNATCVEVGISQFGARVRHSKNRSGPELVFTKAEWVAFVRGVRAGEFDL